MMVMPQAVQPLQHQHHGIRIHVSISTLQMGSMYRLPARTTPSCRPSCRHPDCSQQQA
jgi:hypothetical protein